MEQRTEESILLVIRITVWIQEFFKVFFFIITFIRDIGGVGSRFGPSMSAFCFALSCLPAVQLVH